jgi:Arc/MetJ-type ribon-helix-helix transcriptional regulator
MATKVSAENKEFLRQALKRGRYQSPDQIVNAGLDLLRRQAVVDFIDEGRRQLDEGECTEYSDEELDAFFAELEMIVDQELTNQRPRR